VLRQRGAVAYVRCNESCSVTVRGRLLVAGREYRMRRVAQAAGPGRAARIKVQLTAAGRSALKEGLARRRSLAVRLRMAARDASGNRSLPMIRDVQVRR
jgi:hypothetical protein